MREILFRGKRADNGEWIEGYYAKQSNHACFAHELKYQHFIFKDVCLDFNLGGLQEFEIIPETVGQYTGLTDRNGKKIFEGDIVKTHYANAQKSDFIEQVVFHNGKFCAYFSNQLCKQWANLYDGTEHLPQDKSVYMDSVEVVGNIHDNPELIGTAAKPAAKNIAQSGLAPAAENFELMEG